MADDKDNVGGRDRATVAAGQDYEVEHFAQHHGITVDQARELIQTHGNNRKALLESVAELKGIADISS